MGHRWKWKGAASAKSPPSRIRKARPSKSATCSSTCRRGASSCAPSAPNWGISRSGCGNSRWLGRMSNCASRTTAVRRDVGKARPTWCLWRACRMHASTKHWARNSPGTRCVSTIVPPGYACTAGSRNRPTTAPAPTSNTSTSTVDRCATAASRTRSSRRMPTCCSTAGSRRTCCFSNSTRAGSMSTCIRPSTRCASATRGCCTTSSSAPCTRHWRRRGRGMRPDRGWQGLRPRLVSRGWSELNLQCGRTITGPACRHRSGCKSRKHARVTRRCTARLHWPRRPRYRPATRRRCRRWAMRSRNCTVSTSLPKLRRA